MSYLYIVGDSYCYHREDEDYHWPAILAKKLNLQLQGIGFPGQSWWPVRKHLLDYVNSAYFDKTQYFVICHTQPGRLLSSNPIFDSGSIEADNAKKIWHTYIHTHDVSTWCLHHWFLEINKLLQEKNVIHIKCFEHDQESFSILKGLKFEHVLLKLAIKSAVECVGVSTHNWHKNHDVKKLMDDNHNHLSPQYNKILADSLYQQMVKI